MTVIICNYIFFGSNNAVHIAVECQWSADNLYTLGFLINMILFVVYAIAPLQ